MPAVDELRTKLLDGFIPFNDFAAAIDKHPKTVMRMNPPIVRIGRDVYVHEERGRAWLLNGCKPVEVERRRGRPRGA
jgi:hypothetical protein